MPPKCGSEAYWRGVYRAADEACKRHPPSLAFRMDVVSVDAPVDAGFYEDDFPGRCDALRKVVAREDRQHHAAACEKCWAAANKKRLRRMRLVPAHRARAHKERDRLCKVPASAYVLSLPL